MLKWLNDKTLPQHFPWDKKHNLQSLWAQRQQMTLHAGIIYRVWEDVNGGGKDRYLQLMITRELGDMVLDEIHDSPTGSHLGATKTLDKMWKRFCFG